MRRAGRVATLAGIVVAMLGACPASAEYTIRFATKDAASVANRGVRILTTGDEAREIIGYSASYAIIIGVSDYTGGWASLPGVKEDVEAMQRSLQKHGYSVIPVLNPDSRKLTSALEEFVFEYGYDFDARLLVYFAGHGHTVTLRDGRKVGYLVPADAPHPARDDPTGGTAFRRAAFSMDRLGVLARLIEAKHALFIFDSCFAGTIFGQLNRGAPDYIPQDLTKPIRYFITAGDETQPVPDASVFRRILEKGLGGAADPTPGDGVFLADDLGRYVRKEVAYFSDNSQTPVFGPLRDLALSEGRYVFGLGAAAKPETPPDTHETASGGQASAFIRRYLPPDENSALGKVLRLADQLVRWYGEDGPRYRSHAWSEGNDADNLSAGIDHSRAIWYLFTRAGLRYERLGRYLTSEDMAASDGLMNWAFDRCSSALRTGDVLVYRDAERFDGHVVMVVDPLERVGWLSSGWDGNRDAADTGVEYQQIRYKTDWAVWDRSGMKRVACWRHKDFR